MPHLNNIPGALIVFLAAVAMSYAFWDSVWIMIDNIQGTSTMLYVLMGAMWPSICIYASVFLPFQMMVGDDTTQEIQQI